MQAVVRRDHHPPDRFLILRAQARLVVHSIRRLHL
ncbi:MAG: hypothetical protein ACJAVS_002461 [Paracoccaceae bacterium]|jgi:hypothetical protein